MTVDAARLWSDGELRVPGMLWRALQRFAVRVEPSLIAEWIRLMRGYADRQGRHLDEGQIAAATEIGPRSTSLHLTGSRRASSPTLPSTRTVDPESLPPHRWIKLTKESTFFRTDATRLVSS
jgi:hypothetical protein